MPRVKITLADNIRRVVTVDTDATKGARLGSDLYLPNGQLATPAAFLQWLGSAPATSSGSGSSGGPSLSSILTTQGDLATRGTNVQRLGIGAAGRWLGSSGTLPQWNAPAALTKADDTNVTLTLGGAHASALLNAASLTLGWTGQLAAPRGGTGFGSYTAGDLLYASSTTALSKLGIGGANDILAVSGGAPAWLSRSALALARTDAANTFTQNQRLSLASPVLWFNDTTADRGYLNWDPTGMFLFQMANGPLVFGTNNTTRYAISGAGNHTFAAPSGGTAVSVTAASGEYAVQINGATNDTARFILRDGNTGNRTWGLLAGYGGAGPLGIYDYTNGVGRVTIDTGMQLGAPTGGDKGAGTLNTAGMIYVNNVPVLTGTVPATGGGTGQTGYAAGDLLYASSTTTLSKLGVGSAGQVLTVSGGAPAWLTPAAVNYGTYTPTGAAGTNVSAVTTYPCQYLRIGDVVTVSGQVDATATGSGSTALRITLPVSSNISNTYEAGGAGASNAGNSAWAIRGDATNDAAQFTAFVGAGGAHNIHFSFTYRVI